MSSGSSVSLGFRNPPGSDWLSALRCRQSACPGFRVRPTAFGDFALLVLGKGPSKLGIVTSMSFAAASERTCEFA